MKTQTNPGAVSLRATLKMLAAMNGFTQIEDIAGIDENAVGGFIPIEPLPSPAGTGFSVFVVDEGSDEDRDDGGFELASGKNPAECLRNAITACVERLERRADEAFKHAGDADSHEWRRLPSEWLARRNEPQCILARNLWLRSKKAEAQTRAADSGTEA